MIGTDVLLGVLPKLVVVFALDDQTAHAADPLHRFKG
jgi:hypothetical protein